MANQGLVGNRNWEFSRVTEIFSKSSLVVADKFKNIQRIILVYLNRFYSMKIYQNDIDRRKKCSKTVTNHNVIIYTYVSLFR